MKLLFLDQFSELGGAQQVMLELLSAIRARGWRATIGLPGDGPMFAQVAALGFETVRIECGPYHSGPKTALDFARFAWSTPRLASQIRSLANVDLIYVNGPRLLPAVSLARHAAPVVFHAHSFLPPGRVRRLAGKSLRRLGAQVIANCEFVAQPWREFAGSAVSVIYNGVQGPRPIPGDPGDAIGTIGRIAPEKGQLDFVEAARMIHARLPGRRFVIYGAPILADPAYDREVRRAAENLPIDFAGWASDGHQALAQLELLLAPSAPHEATTRVILEAFASGVPVIAYRSGGIPEIIEDRVNGYLVSDPAEMAQAAIDLLTGPREDLNRIASAARQAWSRRFTLDRFHRELISALERAALPNSH